jgi:hypothetical protein
MPVTTTIKKNGSRRKKALKPALRKRNQAFGPMFIFSAMSIHC